MWKKRNVIPKVNGIICMIIVVGVALTAVCSCIFINNGCRKHIRNISELSSKAMYADINYLLEEPINVSSAMATDVLLQNLMEEEPKQDDNVFTKKVNEYLDAYQKDCNFDSVFLVSCKTNKYYHYAKGVDRVLVEGDPENQWYYAFIGDKSNRELNIDNDQAHDNIITIFVNCKIIGEDGSVLGVVGAGIETAYFQNLINEHEKRYGVEAYLIDKDGNIEVSSSTTKFENQSLFEKEEFSDMKERWEKGIDFNQEVWYETDYIDGYRITKYVPGLNWYLVVEKDTRELHDQMVRQILMNILAALIIAACVLTVITVVLRKFNKDMTRLAEFDQLTGILNRGSYEREIIGYSNKMKTYGRFAIGVFDINGLKNVNDKYGHLVGDVYIKKFTLLLSTYFKDSHIFRIGGDEFAAIFINMDESTIRAQWEELRKEMTTVDKNREIPMDAAFGFAFYEKDDTPTLEDVLRGADEKMYEDKRKRRKDKI